jgi:acyl-CoA synthetase (AMP-forming)/AMP-acid ligase II
MIQAFNISELFYEAAGLHPEKLALIDGDNRITYSALQKQVDETAQDFINAGLKKGDRVLIFVPMSIDLYRIVLALFRMGAVAVFLDEWVSKRRMEACCEIADCKGFIGVMKVHMLRLFSKELRKIPIVLKLQAKQTNTQHAFDPTESTDTALITFTTGSTGTPKAAKRTHSFLNEQFKALREKINPQPGDVDMSLLPIVLLINLGTGATSVIARFKASKPQSFKPAMICEQITKHQVNRMTASPIFITLLSEHLLSQGLALPAVKQVFTGGAPVFPNEAELYTKAFDQAIVEIVYGSTEAEPISSINSRELLANKAELFSKGLPVGKPDRVAEVNIIEISEETIAATSESDLKICPPGTVGEIIVAGPHVLREYFNNEEALKKNKIFIGAKVYHRTGDSGCMDAHGNLFLTGRCSTVFKSKDTMVYPFLYEHGFQLIPGVSAGTVLHMNGETVAVIELHDRKQKKAVESAIRAMPLVFDRICFLKKVPRDPRHHSKIDYEKLKGML